MKALPLFLLFLSLSACSRVANMGQAPDITPPRQSTEFMAMTEPPLLLPPSTGRPEAAASLWTAQPASLVADRRATMRGDILTVVIQIDDKAEISNSSQRSRKAGDKVNIPALAGLPQRIDAKLPDGASMEDLVDAKSSSTYAGEGNVSRREKLTLRVAATVLDTLPNGVLQIEGSQEVRVNFELRELTVSGFVRPADISSRNEIAYDRIAGARISYGGRGQISDVQQPRYGQQVADILLPY
ncbi:flagellar basal body L-ring protein FlgH [uncultured Paracoccus sp.]|uniref:flagellar basal body L-ring protein FlgH n=1 Tax=uncultured Paracoccus sp. TaxID=189685 RepID=UPI002621B814|nr:flagellar basal body L-ring protein FlgH [uncultured Paracoccus sp.]